jgi:glycosyltransferase involved in cell wall biosynthesis
MIKVILIHPYAESFADGIVSHCNSLYQLFQDDEVVEVLKPQNYPYRKIKLFNGLFRFRPLLRAIKDSKADIVHIHGYTSLQSGQALLAAALCRKIIVYSPHWHPFYELRRPFMAKLFFFTTIAPFVRLFVTHCVCINKEDSTFMKKLGKPVSTFPHWITDPPYSAPTVKGKRRLLFVGRFDSANKGIEHLWHLPEGKYDIHLVGKGAIIPRSDMTVHTNIPTDELKQLYLDSDLVVVPSQYEAFSLVALEALSSGTPVVMSDKVRIADYLTGCQGVSIFTYGDYDGFCKAVDASIGMSVDVNRIYSLFSKKTAHSQYATLYKNLMNK